LDAAKECDEDVKYNVEDGKAGFLFREATGDCYRLVAEDRMTSATAGYRRDVAAGDPVTLLLNSSASEFVPHNGGVVDKAWILAFQGLRIVIASAETGSPPKNYSRNMASFGALEHQFDRCGVPELRSSQVVELADAGTAMEQVPDPMIGRLSDALDAAERACDQHSRIYADAVRLAIAIRLLASRRRDGASTRTNRFSRRPSRACARLAEMASQASP